MQYNPRAWFWIVAGDESRVYSSDANGYVSPESDEFVSFIAAGGYATRIASEAELMDVLKAQSPETVLSRRQFYQALAREGFISRADAVAAMSGVIPPSLVAFIDGMTDPDNQFDAQMLLAGAAEFRRTHPLANAIGAANGLSPAQIDEFFAQAVSL